MMENNNTEHDSPVSSSLSTSPYSMAGIPEETRTATNNAQIDDDEHTPSTSSGVTLMERMFPTVTATGRVIQQTAQDANELIYDMQRTSTEANITLREFSKMAKHIEGVAVQVHTLLGAFAEQALTVQRITDLFTLVYDAIVAIWKRCYWSIPTIIIRILRHFQIDEKILEKMAAITRNDVHSIQSKQNARIVSGEAHGFSREVSETEDIWSRLIGIILLKRWPTKTELQYVNEGVRLRDSILKVSGDIKGTVIALLGKLPDMMTRWLHFIVPERWLLEALAPDTAFLQWVDEVNSMDEARFSDLASYDTATQTKIRTLYEQGQRFLQQCAILGQKRLGILRLMESTFRKIDALWDIVDVSGNMHAQRMVPFCVCLTGTSGQGKSFIATVLPTIILGLPPGTPNLSYTRNQALDHWDGYTGQFATQYDDFFAVNNQNASPTECEELMTMVSNQPFPLKMARLEEKGRMFRSRVVILTTNSPYPAPNNMTNRDALWRRRHVMYNVGIKPEFRVEGGTALDPLKARADGNHWLFRLQSSTDPQQPLGRSMSYTEFVEDVKNRYITHVQEQRAAQANADQMARIVTGQGKLSDDLAKYLAENITERGCRELHPSTTELLKRIQFAEVEASGVYKFLLAAVSIAGLMCGSYALMSWVQSTFDEKKNKRDLEYAEKIAAIDRETIIQLGALLNHPRVHKIDAEGRWNRLYTDIKHEVPTETWHEMVEEMSRAMDDHYFGNLTDKEVEAVITATLEQPKVKKLLKAQGVYSGRTVGLPRAMRSVQAKVVGEAGVDKNAIAVTSAVVVPSIVQVNLDDVEMNGIMLGGRHLLVPYHLFYWNQQGVIASADAVLTIIHQDVRYQMYFHPEQVFQIGTDAAVYECDVVVPGCKDILHHFITNDDLNRSKPVGGMLVHREKNGGIAYSYVQGDIFPGTELLHYEAGHGWADAGFQGDYSSNHTTQERIMELHRLKYWRYKAITQRGVCGGALIQFDKFAARKILGIHTAASENTGEGYACAITQEMILKAREHFGACIMLPAVRSLDLKPVGESRIHAEGNFTRLGTMTTPIFLNEKTKIVPSILAGKVSRVTTAPSVLTNRDTRYISDKSVLASGIEKYGKPAPLVNKVVLKRVVDHLSTTFIGLQDAWDQPRVWSEHESLNGIEAKEFADPINVHTSAGYPFSLIPKGPGQSGKMGVLSGNLIDRNLKVSHPTLRDKLDSRLECAKRGVRVESYWVDMLKDERRKLKRVIEGKTRVFTIPPIDFTIIARQYFNDFIVWFYKNKLKTFSAVGINPESIEWNMLFDKWITISSTGFAGDYSGWDGNISPHFIYGFAEIVNKWYNDGPENALVRLVIIDEIVHTDQIAMDFVYTTHVGNPSGNPFTAVINTIINGMYKRYGWLLVVPPAICSPIMYEKCIKDVAYGDDDGVAVHPRVQTWFNPKTYSVVVESLNMTYTNEAKTGEPEIKPIRDFSFLKRGFREDERGFMIATMEKNTIYELLNWIRSSSEMTEEESTISNINEALTFAFGWGREYFDELRVKIMCNIPAAWRDKIFDYAYFYYRYYGDLGYPGKIVTGQANFMGEGFGGKFGSLVFTNSSLPAISAGKAPLAITASDVADVRSSVNSMGIIAENQKAIETSGPTLSPIMDDEDDDMAIPDPGWTLAEMTEKAALIGVYTWTTSQAVKTTLLKLEIPTDLVVSFYQSAPFERHGFWRGAVRFIIHINGMRQHSGRLMAYSVPFVRKEITAVWHEQSLMSSTSLNPVLINPAANTDTVVVVPYYNPKNFISINGTYDERLDFTATFIMQVLSPLRAADCAPASVDVSVWVTFEGSQFRIPLNSNSTSFRAYNEAHADYYRARGGRIVSGQGSSQSSSYNIQAYGNIDGNTMPTMMRDDAFAGASASATASIPAYDRAARTWNPFPIIRKSIQHFTHVHGTETVTRLDTSAANMHVVKPKHFSTTDDEMLMSKLLHTPTWKTTLLWKETDTSGTRLWSNFVGPMCSMFQPLTKDQIVLTNNSELPLTLWEENAMRFRFWRGKIRIRVDIVATVFHTGRLVLSFNPLADPSVETTLRDTSSQYATIIDLGNEKTTFEFDVPYVASTPVLEVCRGPGVATDLNPSNWWTNYFVGSVEITVLQSLVTVCSSPTDVDVILYMAGGPDFEVYMPAQTNSEFQLGLVYGSGAPPAGRIVVGQASGEKEDGPKGGEDAPAAEPIIQSDIKIAPVIARPGHSPLKAAHSHFGEKSFHVSARDLIRRYTHIGYVTPDSPFLDDASATLGQSTGWTTFGVVAGECPFVQWNIVVVNPLSGNEAQLSSIGYNYTIPNGATFLTHFATQYRAWRGSMRYKVIFGDAKFYNGDVKVDSIITNATYGAVFFPHPTFMANVPPIVLVSSACKALGLPVHGSALQKGAAALAADIAVQGIDPVLEIEVPFSTRFNWLPTYTGVLGDQVAAELLTPGLLVFLRIGTLADNVATSHPQLMVRDHILGSVGDDFRLGIFMGAPRPIVFQANPNTATGPMAWPDTWQITVAPTKKKYEEYTEKQVKDAWEEIGIQSSTSGTSRKAVGRIVAGQGAFTSRPTFNDIYEQSSPLKVPSYFDVLYPYTKRKVDIPFRLAVIVAADPDGDANLKDQSIDLTGDQFYLRMQELKFDLVTWSNMHLTESDIVRKFATDYDIVPESFVGESDVIVTWSLPQHSLMQGAFKVSIFPYKSAEAISLSVFDRKFIQDVWNVLNVFLAVRYRELRGLPLIVTSDDSTSILSTVLTYDHARKRMRTDDEKENARIVAGQAASRMAAMSGISASGGGAPPNTNVLRGEDITREPPTDENLDRQVRVDYKAWKEKKVNARSAVNNIKTVIDTANVIYETHQFGPSHAPFFSATCSFSVQNKKYDGQNGAGVGSTKKIAEEKSAEMCLEILHAISTKDPASSTFYTGNLAPDKVTAATPYWKELTEYLRSVSTQKLRHDLGSVHSSVYRLLKLLEFDLLITISEHKGDKHLKRVSYMFQHHHVSNNFVIVAEPVMAETSEIAVESTSIQAMWHFVFGQCVHLEEWDSHVMVPK